MELFYVQELFMDPSGITSMTIKGNVIALFNCLFKNDPKIKANANPNISLYSLSTGVRAIKLRFENTVRNLHDRFRLFMKLPQPVACQNKIPIFFQAG